MEAGEGYRGHIPFHPLQLTFAEQERYQELTLQRLDWTLRSYDERGVTTRGSPRHHSNQDSARRKRHKTQSNASLYSERDHSGRRDLHMPGDNWENPAVLLAVGTIQASLDDVMFGLTTQTFGTCVSVRRQLRHMTDFIILSASGIITRANGDRIGYDLVQPAQLPQLPEVYVETMGHILDTIVMNAMWIAVLGFWEAPRLAEDKKLQWCILNSIKDPTNRQRRVTGTWMELSLCGVCKYKLRRHSRGRDGLPSANKKCAVCGALLCSKFRIKRSFKVLVGRGKGRATRSVHVVVCMTFVCQQSAAEIAWQQNQQRAASDDADSGRTTWGLLDDTSWSLGRSFSISETSFDFSDHTDPKSTYTGSAIFA
ncbi:hypothetical protein PC121_g8285 [Phytophthora cactorum]|nr:hypothetical protein PC121_g8285 [Phytophthora cactorum]